MAIWLKTVTLIFDFDLDRWPWLWYWRNGFTQRNIYVKYESWITYHSKANGQCKSFAFAQVWPWKLILTLTDDLELGTNRKILSQEILMWNMKALTVSNQKIWSMLKYWVFFFFYMMMTLKTDLDLAHDLELVTSRKVLSQGTLMWNMKALNLTNQKIWPM